MRVLVVEDSMCLRQTVSTWLRRHGLVVDESSDGQEGLWLAENYPYDVIVLDILLPKLDGLALLQQLRQKGKQTHVLLLTAKDALADRVRGLEAGADDYLCKPFALEELLARVQALCRRAYGSKQACLVIGDLVIDTTARRVTRAGQPINLQLREYALLEYLARRERQIVTRTEIEEHLYGLELEPASNAVDSAICLLRQRLGEVNPIPLIHTRRGQGYVLELE